MTPKDKARHAATRAALEAARDSLVEDGIDLSDDRIRVSVVVDLEITMDLAPGTTAVW